MILIIQFINFRDDLSQEEFNKILNEYKSELGLEESGTIKNMYLVVFSFLCRFETSLHCIGKLFLKLFKVIIYLKNDFNE